MKEITGSFRPSPPMRWVAFAVIAFALGGCASTAVEQNFASTQQLARETLGSEVKWLRSDEARRDAKADVDRLLAAPLTVEGAVQIALAYSPSLQALLFEGAASSASATQSARLPNPVFAFERLVRNEAGVREIEITRALSLSVLDLILLPSRLRLADYQQQTTRLALAGNVVQAAADVRGAWIAAVAAQQSLRYARQVMASADASAELARRMQAVGNFSKLQRAREQAFAADAVTQLARAAQAVRSTREGLIRALGLDDAQAARLQLPERLPDLPAAPKDEPTVARAAMDQRLDVRLARANLEFIAREQGLTTVTSFVNGLEFGVVSNSETGLATRRGYELSVPLPIFDFGDAARARAAGIYMAALNRAAQLSVDASSQVRENFGAYRTAWDIARHYRDEIVPLRKTIADENVLRYNGMLIGVFELLADSREQITSVIAAIEAQRDFWLADAALQSVLIGRPMSAMSTQGSAPTSASGSSARH